jgi:hypothetical protein
MNIWVPRLKKCGLIVNYGGCDECCGDSYACCVCCSCCEYLSYPCFRGLHHRPCGSYANEQAVTAFPKESGQPVYSVQMLRVQPSIPEKELRLHVQTFYTRVCDFTQTRNHDHRPKANEVPLASAFAGQCGYHRVQGQ